MGTTALGPGLRAHQGDSLETTTEQVQSAVEAGVAAAATWSAVPEKQRSALLHRFADLVEANADALSTLIVDEVGKLRAEAESEVTWTAITARWYADHPPSAEQLDGVTLVRRPIGVIAAITPWNVPLITPAWKWLPALIAGNAVLWKPSEHAPEVARFAARLWKDAGLPPGVLTVVPGGPAVAAALAAHPAVDGVHFTGSTPAGRDLATATAGRFARTALEMGGINPVVVFADADVDAACDAIVASVVAINGQKCTAARLVLVQSSAEVRVRDGLRARFASLRLGNPRDPATDVGPLITVAAADRAREAVRDATRRGARVEAAASLPDHVEGVEIGRFFAPTLISGVSPGDPLEREEVFAPLLVLCTFDEADEAWDRAALSGYGLAGAVHSANEDLQREAVRRLAAGVVNINRRTDAVDLEAPFGGLGLSGNGFPEGGAHVYSSVTDVQAVYGLPATTEETSPGPPSQVVEQWTPRSIVDADRVHEVLQRHFLVDGMRIVLDTDRSRGARLLDEVTGTTYLDMFSFYGANALGMNHPALMEPAFREYLGRIAVNKPASSGVYTRAYAQFVDTFARVVGDPDLPHLFLIEGGALAVENALKIAFDRKSRRNEAAGRPRQLGTQVLHLSRAFHGRSGYTMSLTNSSPAQTDRYPTFDWPRIPVPAIRFPLAQHLASVVAAEEQALAAARREFEQNPHDIACFIAEPIQAEGGDNHMRPEFLQQMQALCIEHDALFVLDEVQTGLGLTGTTWAYQQLGLEPDIVAFGKKFGVCGVMAGRRVDDVVNNVFAVSGRINSTWGGNLTDMVRATRILEVVESDGLVERAATHGAFLLRRLGELHEQRPDIVSSPRGRGLFAAIDLPTREARDALLTHMATVEHVLLLPCGERSIRFRPSLTVTIAELDEACVALSRGIAALHPPTESHG